MANNGEISRSTRMWRHVKDNTAQYLATAVMVGAAAAVLSVRGCGSHERPPMTEEIIRRADGHCHQSESYPYLRNADATIKTTNGTRVERASDCNTPQGNICARNPLYSKEDCHDGDGVCDNATDRSQLRDPAGNPAELLARDVYGREITLPLEDPNSIDCQMQPARDQPCGAVDPSHPVLTRPRIAQPVIGLIQRSQEEMVRLLASHPLIVQTSAQPAPVPSASASSAQQPVISPSIKLVSEGNYFVEFTQYQETCNQALSICTPLSTTACYCPNVRECAEPPPTPRTNKCGNGRLDPGEQCDPRYRGAARGGCRDQGTACSSSCACIRITVPPVCGNGITEVGEECDRTGCGSGQSCNSNCQCEDNQPPPEPTSRCPGDVLQRLQTRAYSDAQSHVDAIRGAVGASSSNGVVVNIHVVINGGVARVQSASGVCVGCVPSSGPRPLSGSVFNLSVVPTGYQQTCEGDLASFTVQPG